MPLDSLRGGAPLDLLFLDAQGWEPDILRGSRERMRRSRPELVFEWWPRALAARGLDAHDQLDWIEADLGMSVSIAPGGAPCVARSDLR